MVVGDKYQGAISETPVRENIKNPDNVCIYNVLPALRRAYGNFTCQSETW